MRISLLCFILFAISNQAVAQEDAMVDKSFLIILSTKSYGSALKKAQKACNKLGLTLNLNGNYEDKEKGLTNNSLGPTGEKLGYIPRGRYDDGDYISIEYTDAYEEFTNGYYIVVVSSGNREDVKKVLPKAKEHYKDAYIKDAKVFMGSMY